mgnify:CR=1 FL=1
MTRKEKIENLRNQIQIRQTEISEMEKELNTEMVTDFYARHNLTPEQHSCMTGKNVSEWNMTVMSLRHSI